MSILGLRPFCIPFFVFSRPFLINFNCIIESGPSTDHRIFIILIGRLALLGCFRCVLGSGSMGW